MALWKVRRERLIADSPLMIGEERMVILERLIADSPLMIGEERTLTLAVTELGLGLPPI